MGGSPWADRDDDRNAAQKPIATHGTHVHAYFTCKTYSTCISCVEVRYFGGSFHRDTCVWGAGIRHYVLLLCISDMKTGNRQLHLPNVHISRFVRVQMIHLHPITPSSPCLFRGGFPSCNRSRIDEPHEAPVLIAHATPREGRRAQPAWNCFLW